MYADGRNGAMPMPVAGPQRGPANGAGPGDMMGFPPMGMPRSPPKNKSEYTTSCAFRQVADLRHRHAACPMQVLPCRQLYGRSNVSFLPRYRVNNPPGAVQVLRERRLQIRSQVCASTHQLGGRGGEPAPRRQLPSRPIHAWYDAAHDAGTLHATASRSTQYASAGSGAKTERRRRWRI